MAEQQTALATTTRKGVVHTFAERFDIDPQKVMSLVAATVFKGKASEPPLTNEEVGAALIVCNAYNLNPFTKEIYAFRSQGKLLIVVSVDGWSTIVNRQTQFNGIEFEEHFDDAGKIQAVTCKIHRKDCALPIIVTEYTHECKRATNPWNEMPIRMTRNRAFVQCARIAFSISGIVDDDEARTIEGNPEFAGRAIIDGATGKTDAVKKLVSARARGTAKQSSPPQADKPDESQQTETVEHEEGQAEEQREAELEAVQQQRTNGNGKAADNYF